MWTTEAVQLVERSAGAVTFRPGAPRIDERLDKILPGPPAEQPAPFTAKTERKYTKLIKQRQLYEGACKLSWPQYFEFREAHPDCTPLTSDDLAYASQWTPCAKPVEPEPTDLPPPVEEAGAFLHRVEHAKACACYTGKVTDEIIELARSVAEAWDELATKLEEQRRGTT